MRPIEIVPEDQNTLKIIWTITNACTYSCEYCPPYLHKGVNKIIDLDKFKTFLKNFNKKNIILSITGGEPTIHPQFIEIAKLLRELKINTVIDSNLSRTRRFYKEAGPLIDNWCVTLHPSQLKELDVEKIKIISQDSLVVVYVMMDPKFWDIAIDWYNLISKIENIRLIMLKPLDFWSNSSYIGKFTKKQLEILENTKPIETFTKDRIEKFTKRYEWLKKLSSTVIWEDNSKTIIETDTLMINDHHKFKGWKCSAVSEVLSINYDGTILGAACGIKKYNNWNNFSITEIQESIICDREICSCGTDIKASKVKL
jgi:organic radical activating enzyme